MNLPLADWIILAALAVVILLAAWYARTHAKVPRELASRRRGCHGSCCFRQVPAPLRYTRLSLPLVNVTYAPECWLKYRT